MLSQSLAMIGCEIALADRQSDNTPRTRTITTFVAIGDPFPGPEMRMSLRTYVQYAQCQCPVSCNDVTTGRACICAGAFHREKYLSRSIEKFCLINRNIRPIK